VEVIVRDSLTAAGQTPVAMNVRVTGPAGGRPILFIHGYSLSSSIWACQFDSDLALDHHLIAIDLPGHGGSAAFDGPVDPSEWAASVHSVLDSLEVSTCTVVAWSYGGVVLGDFLAHGGIERVTAVMLVSAAPMLTPPSPTPTGDAFFDLALLMESPDLETRDRATEDFLRLLRVDPLPEATQTALLADALKVHPRVRSALLNRTVDHRDLFASLEVPVVLVHGDDDALMPLAVSESVSAIIPGSELSRYASTGHAPFIAESDRFNRELRALAAKRSQHTSNGEEPNV